MQADQAMQNESLTAYQDLLSRLQEQLQQYQSHQASELQRHRDYTDQLEAERHARQLLSKDNVQQLLNVVLDEDGNPVDRRSQGEQVNRKLFESDQAVQCSTVACEERGVQVRFEGRDLLRQGVVEVEAEVCEVEVVGEGGEE